MMPGDGCLCGCRAAVVWTGFRVQFGPEDRHVVAYLIAMPDNTVITIGHRLERIKRHLEPAMNSLRLPIWDAFQKTTISHCGHE